MFSWKRIKGPLTVTLVTIMILFIAYTSQIFVIWPFLGPVSLQSMLTLVPLNFCIIMLLVNYFLTCKTNPGKVPHRWMPRQQAYIEVKKSTHAPRFCKTCNNYKPPRTHHCSCCNRCVLKMDHHCPWVNNCVGFANYCHFFRFIIYVDVSTIYLFVLLSCRLAQIIKEIHNGVQPSALEAGFLSVNLVLTVIVMIAVGILSGYHIYCITTNTTTIEGWEKGRSLTVKGMGRIQNIKCPYDQGVYRNMQAVLGKWPLFWFFPQPMSGDGLDFPLNTKNLNQPDEAALDEKNFSSRAALNRSASVNSQWTTATDVYRLSSTEPLTANATPMKPLKTKESFNTIGDASINTVPLSLMTFSSNTSTLVDHRQSKSFKDYSVL
ncbi:DHHC palmitoyltransferase-domain-containing protein [Gilbertella persicaria]|uniref:DHHC palmitoyltransferase-domain-containing protein n=1 Tax=Gilbertella persicaria TaxID=101096 RepID=UPI0022207584|nr:DHHC palmitoyltransferase-domain-containing protein [Gilbertella persicaria]KAI8088048.1 DHHC palmitoyltransferase-domain-containing protein [Gilbertella persicaria]